MRKFVSIIIIVVVISSINGCYYDKEDLVYPKTSCDTTNITYSKDIQSIVNTNCSSCHTGIATSGFDFSSYDEFKEHAMDGDVMDRITTNDVTRRMPQGGPKLSDCDINKIRAWINRNYPN